MELKEMETCNEENMKHLWVVDACGGEFGDGGSIVIIKVDEREISELDDMVEWWNQSQEEKDYEVVNVIKPDQILTV